jgi:hypothetical protein
MSCSVDKMAHAVVLVIEARQIPVFKGCIKRFVLWTLLDTDAEVIAIPLSQLLGIVGEQKRSADAINQVHVISPK